jgi:hypothetical protein
VTVSVTPSAFEMAFAETQIEIKSGQTGTASLILKGVNGASETVALACAPSSSSIGCSVSLTSASTGTTEPVTINAFVPAQTAGIGPLRQDWQGGRASGEYGVGLVLVFLFGWSGRKRRWRLAPSVCTIAILALQVACGGSGGGGATSPPPPPTTTAASVGTYSVLVTGTANGSIHNVKLTVIVQ